MTGKEYFILGSTFFMGILSGMFLYVTVFAPQYQSDDGESEVVSPNTKVIEGRMYGGCEEMDSCASFKLRDNRTYQYLETPQSKVEEGRVSVDIRDAVFDSLDVKTLSALKEDAVSHSCAAYVDGLDYMYEVSFQGKVYTLDTCSTKLAGDKELQAAFGAVWEFMANPTTTYPAIFEKSIIELFLDRFNKGGIE